MGAGPAGISMAVEARYADIESDDILIFEKGAAPAWAIRHHYPDDKLVAENYKGYDILPEGALGIGNLSKDDTLSYLERAIAEHALRVRHEEPVMAIKRSVEDLFVITTNRADYRAKNCVIAIGILEKPRKPDYRLPPPLYENILFDLAGPVPSCKDILVVGGGESAFEAAILLSRRHNRISLSYRRREFNRLCDSSRDTLAALEAAGAITIFRESNIVKLANMRGRPGVLFAEEKFGQRVFDKIVYCLGGTTPRGFLKAAGIDFLDDSPIIKKGNETNVPGLFLIGDLSAGARGGSVNWAFNSSHAAMRKICDRQIDSIIGPSRNNPI